MSNCDVRQQVKSTKFLPDITVNGRRLDKNRLAREIQYHPAASFGEALHQAASALVLRELLRHEVLEELKAGKKEEEAIAALIEAATPAPEVSPADCERFYQQNPQRFSTAPLMRVRHLLLPAAKDDLEARAEQKRLAERLLAELKAAPDLHTAWCSRLHLSRCPSRAEEGLLGELSPGQTVPEFERQVFALEEGLAPQPLATRYGWHVVWVESRRPGQIRPYEQVAEDIAGYLRARRQRQAVADYLYGLVARADIVGIELRPNDDNIVLSG